jgi:hypothetical protein
VVAYSTCSQLGYMFFAAGVGAYSAAMFHLMTHAFFKALLFLGSGSVINCLHHEQDMRTMGGVKEKAPQTFILMWIGTPGAVRASACPSSWATASAFAGFYSKDAILEASYGAPFDGRHDRLLAGRHRRLHDGVLLDAPDVPDLLRALSRRPSHLGPCATNRRPVHADPALLCWRPARRCRAWSPIAGSSATAGQAFWGQSIAVKSTEQIIITCTRCRCG